MAIRATKFTLVANTPVVIADGTNGDAQAPKSFLIKPDSANATVFYVGGDDLTGADETTDGYPVAATDPAIGVDLFGGDQVYAVSADGGQVIHVLKTQS